MERSALYWSGSAIGVLTLAAILAVAARQAPTSGVTTAKASLNPPAQAQDSSPPAPSPDEPKAEAGDLHPSPAAVEIARMAESGVDNTVIKRYVENAMIRSRPTADDIIYLRNHGLSQEVITAMIRRAQELEETAAISTTNSNLPPVFLPIPNAPPPGFAPTPIPPTYGYAAQSVPSYPTPGYDYPSAVYPPIYTWVVGNSFVPFFAYGDARPHRRPGRNRPGPVERPPYTPPMVMPPPTSQYGVQGSWGGGAPIFHRPTYGIQGSWGGGTPVVHANTYGVQGSWGGGTPLVHRNTYGVQGSWGGGTPVFHGRTVVGTR